MALNAITQPVQSTGKVNKKREGLTRTPTQWIDDNISSHKAIFYALTSSIALGSLYISACLINIGNFSPLELIEFLAISFGLYLAIMSYAKTAEAISKMYETSEEGQRDQLKAVHKYILIGEYLYLAVLFFIAYTFFAYPVISSKFWELWLFGFAYTENDSIAKSFIIVFRIGLISILYYTYVFVNNGIIRSMEKIKKCQSDDLYDRVILGNSFFLFEENLPTQLAYMILLFLMVLVNFYEAMGSESSGDQISGSSASVDFLMFAGGAAAFHMALSALKFFHAASNGSDVSIIRTSISMYYAAMGALRSGLTRSPIGTDSGGSGAQGAVEQNATSDAEKKSSEIIDEVLSSICSKSMGPWKMRLLGLLQVILIISAALSFSI